MSSNKETKTFDKLTEFLLSNLDQGKRLIKNIVFEKKQAKQSYLIALYLSLVEFIDGLSSIIKLEHYILTSANVRCILETYVDFENIYRDEQSIKNMELDSTMHNLRQFKKAKEGNNPYLVGIAQIENIDDLIKALEDKLNSFKQQNIARLGIRERFDNAGMQNEYDGLYRFLSSNTHSSLSALYYRHFEKDGDSFAIVFGKDLSPERLIPYLDIASGLLLDATKKINILYGDKDGDKFKALEDKLTEIRKEY